MRYGTEKLNAKPGMFASLVDVVVESLVSALVVNQILDIHSLQKNNLSVISCNQFTTSEKIIMNYLFLLQGDAFPELKKDPEMVRN